MFHDFIAACFDGWLIFVLVNHVENKAVDTEGGRSWQIWDQSDLLFHENMYNFSVLWVWLIWLSDVFSVILFILLWPASAHVLHNGAVLFLLLLFFMPLLLSLLAAVLKIFSLHFGSGSGFCHLGNQSYPVTKILSQWR